MIFTTLLFDSGVCLPFNNGKAANLKKNYGSTAKNQNLHEQTLRLFTEKEAKKVAQNVPTSLKKKFFQIGVVFFSASCDKKI